MATTTGQEYSYVDIVDSTSQNLDTVRHYYKDETARTALNTVQGTVDTLVITTIPSIQANISNSANDLIMQDDRLYLKNTNGRIGTGVELDVGVGFDSGELDDGRLYFKKDGSRIQDVSPIDLRGLGGGGGGSTSGITASLTRVGSGTINCIYGDTVNIQFNFSAVDQQQDTVQGKAYVVVNNSIVQRNISLVQGTNTLNISSYLKPGDNSIKVYATVEDMTLAPKSWVVNALNLYFTWDFDEAQVHQYAFYDYWTPYGNTVKTTHTVIDNNPELLDTTSDTGIPRSLQIGPLNHGWHTIERWVTAQVGEDTHSTEHQFHKVIFIQENNTTPIISINKQNFTMDQYNTEIIPIVIYDPSSETADADLYVDNVLVASLENQGRTVYRWAYTPTTAGQHTLAVVSGEVREQITVNVSPVSITINEVNDYAFKFKASEFATNNAVKAWDSNGVTVSFSNNFDWVNGGLHTEKVDANMNEVSENEDGTLQQYFCVKAGTRMTINHKMFEDDAVSAGLNYKIIFKTKNVADYDAEFGSCFSDDVGIKMSAHEATLSSVNRSISVPYEENEYTELEFDVYPKTSFRYMMAWLDGVITTARVYTENDSFVQTDDIQDIVIGSDDCDVYIYLIKVYQKLVARENHIDNFIADAPNSTEMIRRYNRNDILTDNEIDAQKLANKNPDCRVWTYDIPRMTTSKDTKISGCQFAQIWEGGGPYYQLTGTGTMSVQGTSSVDYIRGAANTDINFVGGSLYDGNNNDLLANGVKDSRFGNNLYLADQNTGLAKEFTEEAAREAAGLSASSEPLGPEWIVIERDSNGNPTTYIKALGFKLNDDSVPITYSNTKVNFASCEQVNNMCNAAWYQKFSPYTGKTPRDCMEFNIGVQFIKDNAGNEDSEYMYLPDGRLHMYSIANMGTSKKNVHIFHDLSNENECCIEVNNNTNNLCRMVDVTRQAFDANDWSDSTHAFGMRYPDTKNPSSEIKEAWYDFISWMSDNNPWQATNASITPETYGTYTFRGHDGPGTQVLRGVEVKQYAGTYTQDTFERRMAKMLSECEDHMIMDSVVYHFVYIERHTMCDNVAKNTFWTCSDLNSQHQHWDLSKAYDMDTSDGNNNEGELVFDYGNEYDDVVGPKDVFNAQDSVWFRFIANLPEACAAMFNNRSNVGANSENAWSSKDYHNFLTSQQKKIPERVWVQCYWLHYLRTYEQNINDRWINFLDGGQKIHQRSHFETFQDPYIASKYGSSLLRTSQTINLRGYAPNNVYNENTGQGLRPRNEVYVKMYNKMYCVVDVDGKKHIQKINRGETATINFEEDGRTNDTVINIYPAKFIQEISGLAQLYVGHSSFSDAVRLQSLAVGSDRAGYSNTGFDGIDVNNNPMLKYLYLQNLPNANTPLDLTNCPELEELYATDSGFTGYEFANNGKLRVAQINKPTSLILRNLSYLYDSNFTIQDLTALRILRHENTPGVNVISLINASNVLRTVRLIGVDWNFQNGDFLAMLYNMRGLDENGSSLNRSVVSGTATVSRMGQRAYDLYTAAWDLDIICNPTPEHVVRFIYQDGSPVLDGSGNAYIQYIEDGGSAHDPVLSGEIDEPAMAPDGRFLYTYTGWDYIPTYVQDDVNVTAQFSSTPITYTVRWFADHNSAPLKTVTGVDYGSEVFYDENDPYNFPTYTSSNPNVYGLFAGWDASTGYIREDTDVYAIWDVGSIPPSYTTKMNEMTPIQIYSIAKTRTMSNYNWQGGVNNNYVDIDVGKDYNFRNVYSEVLAEEMVFDGTNGYSTDVPLFDEDSPSFTLAVDFEFLTSDQNRCLVSCFSDADGTGRGFRLDYANGPTIVWGNRSASVGSGRNRNILVLSHRKGTKNLLIKACGQSGENYTGSISSYELVSDITHSGNMNLVFGGILASDGGYINRAKGIIHWCKLWKDELGARTVTSLASWIHEKWRMEYYGAERYIYGNSASQYCAASFVSRAPLKLKYDRSSASSGWNTSEKMYRFVNEVCFDALPTVWQAMIRSVKLPCYIPNSSNIPTYINSKMYIPADVEVLGTSSSPYLYEGSRMPQFTSTNNRTKYLGFIRPYEYKYIENTTDPTLLTQTYSGSNAIKDGDIWYNSNSGSYTTRIRMYLSAETVSKIGTLNSSYTTAQGEQGGVWIYATRFWTRTPVSDSASWRVSDLDGSYTSGSTGVYYGVVPCFSI